MTPGEQGFLLLTSHLGDPERRPLTVAQFRTLTLRMRQMEKPSEDRPLQVSDLTQIGYHSLEAQRIVRLMEGKMLLSRYLQAGKTLHCLPITRVSAGYPAEVRKKLGLDAPASLWAKGNLDLLNTPKISLVGSRELSESNRIFAQQVGWQAARQGYTLVSGNARGADRAAQDACLQEGGNVISVVADELQKQAANPHVLYLSEETYDGAFSSQRALSRNRVIHCLGSAVFVAQSDLGQGGTWDGTTKNLKNHWSPVYCFPDGSPGIRALIRMGAGSVEKLSDFESLQATETEMKMEDFL